MRAPSSRPAISVLLPYRDAAETIEAAIASVLAEDEDLELLAVDDRSSDDSAERVAKLRDPRIIRLDTSASPRGGIVAALELARRKARAPWLARMDADDLSLARLGAQRATLEGNPRLGLVATQVEAFAEGPDEVGAGLARYVAWQNALLSPTEHRRARFVESPVCHPATMLRADALRAVGGYREGDFAEDYELWLRLFAAGWEMKKLPFVGLRWRHRKARQTFTDPRCRPAAFLAVKADYLVEELAARAHDRPLGIWGAGPVGRALAWALDERGRAVDFFVDIDPRKVGRTRRGAPVVAPESLKEMGAHVKESDSTRPRPFILGAVGARGARALIRERLRDVGLEEERDVLFTA